MFILSISVTFNVTSGVTTEGNGNSRLRAPLERGHYVQTAIFFLFCLITKPTLP